MRRSVLLAAFLLVLGTTGPAVAAPPPAPLAATPVQVYGAWHCGDDFCTWGTARTVAQFDSQNHWLVDRGDGRPSVNLVVLSFVNPLDLLHQTTDATTLDGVPRGMTSEIVQYFTTRGVRVMLSIGGITYTDDWDTALAENPTLLGQRAAAAATRLGVGIEIDYEQNTDPNLAGLQSFIDAYRAVHPYDATGARPPARLTIDVAAGDRWLIDLNRKATADWLRTDAPVLDYANAMVTARPVAAGTAQANWQEHVDGKAQYSPPVPPLAPAKFTGAVYLAYGGKPLPECVDYATSVQKAAAPYVQSVAPHGAGSTAGMLGFMFWAAERPATRGIGTVPPNTCERGAGAGATALAVPVPMPALRQG
ncbi:hypothetical protein ACFFMM_26620 [Micromonospora chaiyaphumensis]|uniref:Glycosyl hydrolases family 18 n=1 Tax=Micromonospora chaiyaphumensis TaxID=307119 RepID=A0A1C4U9V1_9ACTN|nr:hypothetical protein [Micromonospora chaiyaphumensis]SCE68485.1 hypothetical protein GA0070214_101483 [Micromonospora chaiyaphumensis]